MYSVEAMHVCTTTVNMKNENMMARITHVRFLIPRGDILYKRFKVNKFIN